jgi:hypothetical protein
MPTLAQCFSALVASGNGLRCNEFRDRIRQKFLVLNEETGQPKSVLFKYGYDQYPRLHKQLRIEMGQIISSLADDLDPVFFGPDLETNNVQQK